MVQDYKVNPYSVIEVAPENGSRDGGASVDVCSTDSWSGEIYYILLIHLTGGHGAIWMDSTYCRHMDVRISQFQFPW